MIQVLAVFLFTETSIGRFIATCIDDLKITTLEQLRLVTGQNSEYSMMSTRFCFTKLALWSALIFVIVAAIAFLEMQHSMMA